MTRLVAVLGGLLVILTFSALSQPPSYAWIQQAGGSGEHSANAAVVGSDGTVVIAGSLRGSATFGTNTLNSTDFEDIFVAKYSANGANLWAQKFGSSANISVSGLAIDPSGSIYVLEQANSAFTVLKLSSSGVLQWSQKEPISGPGGCSAQAICADLSGCYVAGQCSGSGSIGGNPFSSPSAQALLCHFNPSGSVLWIKIVQRVYGSPSSLNPASYASATTLDPAGNVYCGGQFIGTNAWGNAFAQTNLSGINWTAFLAKYTRSGNLIWVEALPEFQELRVLAGDEVGHLTALADLSILRLSQNGDVLWSMPTPDLSTVAVCSTPDGSAYVAGIFSGDVVINSNTFHADQNDSLICKLNASGSFEWTQIAGPGEQNILALAGKSSGELLVAGAFQATSDFPPFTLTSSADMDVVVALLGAGSTNQASTLSIGLYPGLSIGGVVGLQYRIEYSDALQTNWQSLTNVTLTTSPFLWFDTSASVLSHRFYRTVVAP